MDLNLVRLSIPLPAAAAQQLTNALTTERVLFEQSLSSLCTRSLSSDAELVRRHQKPSLPFIFSLPCEGQLECLLLGPAIAELPRVLSTVAARAGLAQLTSFGAYDYQGGLIELQADGEAELPVLSLAALLDLATPRYADCQRLRVTLLTPLRLVTDGRELSRFVAERFVRGVLRRISALTAYYGTAAAPEQFIRLASQAGALRLLEARPLPAPRGARGLLGSFDLQGSCSELGPMLELGGLLHVGKGASYGLGAFRISPLS
ncbi:MAG: CRISPR system precrRNA processing endoribonuclease RAMP protein Cas6 [Geobacter sp.]